MITVSPNPIFLSIGPINIYYYGLVYALGFLFVYWWLHQRVKRKKLSMKKEDIDIFMIYAIIGGVVGGRLGEFIFFQPQIIFSNPLEILKVWHGGMAIHGGVLGLSLAIYLFSKKYRVKFYEITDNIVIPTAIVLIFGRIANFINAELVGTITKVPWAVNWFGETNNAGDLVGRHPSQIYESLKNAFIATTLFMLSIKEESFGKYKNGFLTWSFIFLYGILRTIVTIWREDTRWFLGILGTGQVLSLIMAIIAGIILIRNYRKGNKNNENKNKSNRNKSNKKILKEKN